MSHSNYTLEQSCEDILYALDSLINNMDFMPESNELDFIYDKLVEVRGVVRSNLEGVRNG
jgi:hypothetical protein